MKIARYSSNFGENLIVMFFFADVKRRIKEAVNDNQVASSSYSVLEARHEIFFIQTLDIFRCSGVRNSLK